MVESTLTQVEFICSIDIFEGNSKYSQDPLNSFDIIVTFII